MTAVQSLPKDVSKLGQEVKLFGKWDTQEFVPSLLPYARTEEINCSTFQRRGEGHLTDGLHPNTPCRLSSPYRWPIRQEAVQEGSNANSGTARGQVSYHIAVTSVMFTLSTFSLMMKGRNNGKKLLAVRIVAHAFEIIHLLTDQNPIQVWLFLYAYASLS
jgi:small subunit ribosomal protein S5e